jgi:hypothetical protein
MKIDRSNYEVWFIDWIDGNLDNIRIEQLNCFLAANPDLKDELKEMAGAVIKPPLAEFTGKGDLKKAVSDLSGMQFDYLSAAYFENDLSHEESAELSDIINSDPHRKKSFELSGRLKLVPSDIRFKNKKRLLKRTPLVIRLAVAGISAAATVALLATLYLLIPDNGNDSRESVSQILVSEEKEEQPAFTDETEYSEGVTLATGNKKSELPAEIFNNITESGGETEQSGSLPEFNDNRFIRPAITPSISEIVILGNSAIITSALIPLYPDSQTLNDVNDDRLTAGKFFAKLFRERILKSEMTDEGPIKGYEIAEAGVTGLNRLLGWEMDFEKYVNENGETKSIYFSSKILKVQAPVNRPAESYSGAE